MTDQSTLARAQFAVDHPDCLHSPAEFRELLAGMIAENRRLRSVEVDCAIAEKYARVQAVENARLAAGLAVARAMAAVRGLAS